MILLGINLPWMFLFYNLRKKTKWGYSTGVAKVVKTSYS